MNNKGYTLVEIILTIAISSIVVFGLALGILTYRNNIQYDILLNQIVESVNYSKVKAKKSYLDSSGLRSSYGVKFFEDRFVEFEGETYVEGANTNVEYNVPIGLRLSSSCSPSDNGTVVFSPILSENTNTCIVYIYKMELLEPSGNVVIGKYGVEEAI